MSIYVNANEAPLAHRHRHSDGWVFGNSVAFYSKPGARFVTYPTLRDKRAGFYNTNEEGVFGSIPFEGALRFMEMVVWQTYDNWQTDREIDA